MEKLFVRIHEWIKDKDPNTVVDISAENHCKCCLIKDIPLMLKDMWVFYAAEAPMKEAYYASDDFKNQHSNEKVWLIDAQPKITVEDVEYFFSDLGPNENAATQTELLKFFFLNGKPVNLHTVLTDEEIEWVNQRSSDIIALFKTAMVTKEKIAEAKNQQKSCFSELEELLNKKE